MSLPEINTNEHEPNLHEAAEARAERYYTDLPYHNFEHAKGVAERASVLADRALDEGVLVNKDVVYYAALFHDAGYHEDHKALGFETKEDYSIDIAQRELSDLSIDPQIIEEVVACIEATKKDSSAETDEAKLVRLADIYNIGENDDEAGYEVFLANSVKLRAEAEQMSGVTMTWDEFKEKQIPIIEAYLAQDLSVTNADRDENGVWIFGKKGRNNIERYRQEPETLAA